MKFQPTRGLCLSFFMLGWFCANCSALAQDSSGLNPPAPSLTELVRRVIIETSKNGYEDQKHWNKSVTRFDGFKIHGMNVSPRKRSVRHGFCRKYAAELRNPDKTFHLQIQEISPPDNTRIVFLLESKIEARCEATFAHYVYGVKGLNGTTVADAEIRIRIQLSLDPQAEFSLDKPIPKLNLNARVEDVDFSLKDIDLHKVGVLDGKVVEVIGDGLKSIIEEVIQDQEKRVRSKLQKELDHGCRTR